MKTILRACPAFVFYLIFSGNIVHAQSVNINDSLALVNLYDSCNGPGWRLNTNWLTGSVSTWYGVTVTGNRVTDLNLNYNYLTGSLPSSIGNLTALKTFTAEDNTLTGAIPSSIGNLTSLTSFSLYDNQLTDSIPSSIGNLVNLTYLQLGYNQLTGSLPSSMGNLTAMQVMSITYDQLSGSIPSSLGNLTNMTTLYLNNNQLTGEVPASFSNLTSLTLLLLLHNKLEQQTNSFPVEGAIDYLNFNNFTFDGIEPLVQQKPNTIYYPQNNIAIHTHDSSLSVYAGGTLSNNTYTWYLVGQPDISTTIAADSVFYPPQVGQYYSIVNNAIATQLTLTSDTVNYAPVNDSNLNAIPLKYVASDTGAINLNIAKDKNGNVYIIYRELASGKATVRRFNGSSWQTIGKPRFSAGKIYYPSIAVNSAGTPYVVYQDAGKNFKATVMMYNGTSWVNVGAPGISVDAAAFTTITITKTGIPVISYADAGLGNDAVVKSFNGGSWVSLGQSSFPIGVASYTYLTTGPDGKIYLACNDAQAGSKARVVVFNGSTWTNVGNAGFSATNANIITMKFDKNNVPFVAYQDGNDGHGTMMKLQTNQWVVVGKRNAIGNGTVQYLTFDFSTDNTPYVAFEDVSDHLYVTVQKFTSSKWTVVGSQGFTHTQSEYTNMFFDKQGVPSVVFTDYDRNYHATLTQYNNSKWTDMQDSAGVNISKAISGVGSAPYNSVQLFPNPAVSITRLSFYAKASEPYQIIVTGSGGKTLEAEKGITIQGYNLIDIYLANYTSGLYYVQLVTPPKNEKMKLIKLR